jgi:glycosyltransferase involved in cell wall biosynthesis
MPKTRVLVSAFYCHSGGVSEAYSSYKWVEQIARFNDVTLLSGDQTSVPPGVQLINPSRRFRPPTALLRRMNGELHFDYFWFNRCARRKVRSSIDQYDIVHYLSPIAPRYPCALGRMARNFIIGPIGGGLRAPRAFRKEVEGAEPFFYKLRGLDRWRLRYDPVLRRTFAAAKCILIAGRYMFDILPEEYHSKCVIMLDTGIDSSNVTFQPVTEIEPGARRINLLYAGRLVPYKGLLYALKALGVLSESQRNLFQLHIVGNEDQGRYEQECRRLIADQNLEQTVRFYGRLPKEEVFKLYDLCDLFVFPSLAEAGGNVVIEAMSKGRPVLAVNCGGPAEVVTPESGFLLEAASPDSLVNGIAAVLAQVAANPRQLAAKSLASRKVIDSDFDWRVKGAKLQAIYNSICPPGLALSAIS